MTIPERFPTLSPGRGNESGDSLATITLPIALTALLTVLPLRVEPDPMHSETAGATPIPAEIAVTAMPLPFTENCGQFDPRVRFQAHTRRATVWITGDGVYYDFLRPRSRISTEPMASSNREVECLTIGVTFIHANPSPSLAGAGLQQYHTNYLIGSDPLEWRTGVPNYDTVVFNGIYSGIDLKYYGNSAGLEYDFIVSPGADASQIEVRYDGATSLSIDGLGNLVVETSWGTVTEHTPRLYQFDEDRCVELSGRYTLISENSFGFRLDDSYNPALALVIDPTLTYSTYLGGGSDEYGYEIAVDGSGSAYVMGVTFSSDFPTVSSYDGTHNGSGDVFIAKVNAAGSGLVYSTYIGGGSDDFSYGIAVDGSGNAYITGYTQSTNFPTLNSYQAMHAGGTYDAFVTKLNSAGDGLEYSTYLGGGADDLAVGGIAVDGGGNAYVTGWTTSTNFPTVNAYQSDRGLTDVFVTKLNAFGNGLEYSTYLGGNLSSEEGWGIAVDGDGNAYVVGKTNSSDFPTVNPYDGTLNGTDAFVVKLNSLGNGLIYGTYLGGTGSDGERCLVAVDGDGNAYVTGWTTSTDYPMVNAYQASYGGGGYDAFVTKLNSDGDGLEYSTYLGGNGQDFGDDIAVDGSGHAHIVGRTQSTNFPTVDPHQANHGGGIDDAFVAELNSAGDGLVYGTYLGGSGQDFGDGVAVDDAGDVYLTGRTSSSNFPTASPYDGSIGGAWDAFVAKIGELPCPCPCFADPNCDGVTDVLDVVLAGDVAFGSEPPTLDPPCTIKREDVDCNGVVNALDIADLLNVAFRNADASVAFCNPNPGACTPPTPPTPPPAGGGSVLVESKTFMTNQDNCKIGIYINNSVALNAIVLPLEMRSVSGGAYPASSFTLTVRSGGRVKLSGLDHFTTLRYYGTPEVVNCCSGPVSSTWKSGEITPGLEFYSSSDAVFWEGNTQYTFIDSCLGIGNDPAGTPSIELSFTTGGTPGTFEIDTACVTPQNHLLFVECSGGSPFSSVAANGTAWQPGFTKGTVTVTDATPPVADYGDAPDGIDACQLSTTCDAPASIYPTNWLTANAAAGREAPYHFNTLAGAESWISLGGRGTGPASTESEAHQPCCDWITGVLAPPPPPCDEDDGPLVLCLGANPGLAALCNSGIIVAPGGNCEEFAAAAFGPNPAVAGQAWGIWVFQAEIGPTTPDVPAYANVVVDLNQSGVYGDGALEWTLTDEPLQYMPGQVQTLITEPFFPVPIAVVGGPVVNWAALPFWTRFTVGSEQISFAFPGGDWDGSGEAGGYDYGETEDWVVFGDPEEERGACCDPGGDCKWVTQDSCAALGGTFHGAGTFCRESDIDSNGVDDMCEPCLPPGPYNDTTSMLAYMEILVHPDWRDSVKSLPGYDSTTAILRTGIGFDPQIINMYSAPYLQDDAWDDYLGVQVGVATGPDTNIVIVDSDFPPLSDEQLGIDELLIQTFGIPQTPHAPWELFEGRKTSMHNWEYFGLEGCPGCLWSLNDPEETVGQRPIVLQFGDEGTDLNVLRGIELTSPSIYFPNFGEFLLLEPYPAIRAYTGQACPAGQTPPRAVETFDPRFGPAPELRRSNPQSANPTLGRPAGTAAPGDVFGWVIKAGAAIGFDDSESDSTEFMGAMNSIEALIAPCVCTKFADPANNGAVVNVFDVVKAVDVAFRSAAPTTDPGCPKQRTDVNCDNVTNVFDVVKFVDVAFRAANPATAFCDPCG